MRKLLLNAFRAWGRGHARKLALAGLDGVYAQGLSKVEAALREGPCLFAANHVAWWDGLLYVLLSERLGAESRVLMDARRLRSHRFFEAFGVMPIGEDVARELGAAAATLAGPGRALWIFPQGRQRPETARPLGFRPGVARLAAMSGARVVPVALRYPMLESPRPRAMISFGEPTTASDPAELERQVVALLERPLPEAWEPGEALVAPRPRREGSTRALSWLYARVLGGFDG